ncbi:MAG: DUF4956 domain-containing protein [Kiritimatiellaeota bacterium]|nr:DUF4956 domain-containing protein [Kiritimatiellota bacterium]
MLFGTSGPLSFMTVLGLLLLSFMLSFMYAAVYQRTFNGFSYSRTFVQSMILGSLVTCALVMAVGDSLSRGLGIMGTLTIIRFRTLIRDPRDAMFLFASLGTGIACGAGMVTVAVGGTIAFTGVALFLHVAPFASRRNYEGMLRFTTTKDAEVKESVDRLLMMMCESFTLVAMRNALQGGALEYSYHIRLRDPSYQKELVRGLSEIEGIFDPLLMMQRSTVEV